MDGFKSLPKMQCFKEGGSVKNKMPAFLKKETKSEVKMDKSQDKSMVKKGVKQHESALHKGEPKTELKLKTGGRAKKAAGTVKKFEKASGQYGAKKTAADKKNIKEAKQFKPAFKNGGKACSPAAKKTKKMQSGGPVDVKDPQALVDKIALEENTADANIIPNALKAVKRVGKKVIKSAKDMFGGQGAVSDAEKSNIAKKKGGKVKKYAEGGAVLSDEEKNWLGGADATDPFILARMRSALGNKKPAIKPQMASAPAVEPAMDKPYQAPNVEQDSGLAYPQENEMRSAPMAPPPVRRPAPRQMPRPVRSTDTARLNQMAQGQGVFPEGSDALIRPYVAPNVEQDSGLDYPIKPGFFNATPGQQAAQFNRSAQQRKNVGRKIGDFLGLNKKQGT
jgi:hypothetical protein